MRAPSLTLCLIEPELRSSRLLNHKWRDTDVQRQMSLLEPPQPAGAAPVWSTLDDQQRAKVVATLATLIAKAAQAPEDRQEQENE